jgi:hypothetical protein
MAIPFVSGPKIAAGQSLSDVLDCSTAPPVRITMPAAWTAAHLTFLISSDGVTFGDLVDMNGQEVRANVIPNTVVRLSSALVTAPVFLKFRSGTRAVPIAQTDDRIFGCSMTNDQTGSVGPAGPQGPAGPAGPAGAAGPSAVSANAGNLANLGTDSLILVPNTSVLKGTTAADNAAAGMAGEQLAVSQATPISLTTGVTVNVATLALPPGDWSCSGVVVFDAGANTLPTMLAAAMSAASATLPTVAQVVAGNANMTQYFLPFSKSADHIMQAGIFRMNVSSNTNVFLVAQSAFSGGTLAVTGYISARRVR